MTFKSADAKCCHYCLRQFIPSLAILSELEMMAKTLLKYSFSDFQSCALTLKIFGENETKTETFKLQKPCVSL